MKLTYPQAIKACKKDLKGYSPAEIRVMLDKFGVRDIGDLAQHLIDQHYPEQRGNMPPNRRYRQVHDAIDAEDWDAVKKFFDNKDVVQTWGWDIYEEDLFDPKISKKLREIGLEHPNVDKGYILSSAIIDKEQEEAKEYLQDLTFDPTRSLVPIFLFGNKEVFELFLEHPNFHFSKISRKNRRDYIEHLENALAFINDDEKQMLTNRIELLKAKFAEHPILPYGGDMQKAMANQDRDAIRQIMQYRQSQEAERNRRLIQEQESRKLSDTFKDCSNDADLISLEDWSETNEPNLKIKYMSTTNPFEEIERIVCYDAKELERWVDYPTNTFAAWIPNRKNNFNKPNDDGMGPPGSGGYGPAKSQKYIKLPDGNFVQFYNPEEITTQTQLIAFPYAKKRVGNIRGTYGVSELHGQAPDKTIYFVYPENHHLQEGVTSLLKEDYESRFPLPGFSLDKENDTAIREKFIEFFKKNHPKELAPELKELFGEKYTDTHQVIDDIVEQLWPSIGYNELITGNQPLTKAYHYLYKTIGRENIMDYWLYQVINPFIDSINPMRAHAILEDIHNRVPQSNEDYDQDMFRIQEIVVDDSSPTPPTSPLLVTAQDIEEMYRQRLNEFVQAVENNFNEIETLQRLEDARSNYYDTLFQNAVVSNVVNLLNIEQTLSQIEIEKTKLTEMSEIRDNFIQELLQGQRTDPASLFQLEKQHENILKTLQALYKHRNDLQSQPTSRQLDFGDVNSNLQEEYTIALNNLIEELRTEDQTDTQVLFDEFEYASNNYYEYISRNPEISQEISNMNLNDTNNEIERLYNTIHDNLDNLLDFYEIIRQDINLSGNDVNQLLMLERRALKLHKEIKALELHRNNLLRTVPQADMDIESDDSQATIVFEPNEPMEESSPTDFGIDTQGSFFNNQEDSDTESVFDPDEN